jgi:hypothetical protein
VLAIRSLEGIEMKPVRDLLKALKALRVAKKTGEAIMSSGNQPTVGKGLLQSKTFWVNLITGGTLLLQTIGGMSILPGNMVPYVGAGLAVMNILLRLVTDKPITAATVS